MNDLFYSAVKFEENIKQFKLDVKRFFLPKYKDEDNYSKLASLATKSNWVCRGNKEFVGNNILLVLPPFRDEPYFSSKEIDLLFTTCNEYKLSNIFVTYCFPFKLETLSKSDIKTYSFWLQKLTNIIKPSIIVTFGEEAELAFIKRKFILNDYHGQLICKYDNTPIILTYPMSYYLDTNKFEDDIFKKTIRDKDWSFISKVYKDVINANT